MRNGAVANGILKMKHVSSTRAALKDTRAQDQGIVTQPNVVVQVCNLCRKKGYLINYKDTYVPFYDFLIPIASFITDFRYVPYHACGGRRITSQETAEKAFEACDKQENCNCIKDPQCDHDEFILYTENADRDDDACSWNKVLGSPI